jgi:hypothetical protein
LAFQSGFGVHRYQKAGSCAKQPWSRSERTVMAGPKSAKRAFALDVPAIHVFAIGPPARRLAPKYHRAGMRICGYNPQPRTAGVPMSSPGITAALVGAMLALAAIDAWAGPCTGDIAQFEAPFALRKEIRWRD